MTVGVAIPSIPPRNELLLRALDSVLHQTSPPDQISVVVDTAGEGAAATRNRAWRALDTTWVAFLDDDDELLPLHLQKLHVCALDHHADLVYPWFDVIGGGDPFPHHFGQPWDPEHPHQTTITCLWRRTALEGIGGFPPHSKTIGPDGHWIGEDWLAVQALNAAAGRIVHLPERTWLWHMHGQNTMGMAENWSAA